MEVFEQKGAIMKLQGCYPAIITPFHEDLTLDEEGLRKNVEFLLSQGVAGVVPCGTTGESATLSWDEHRRVVDIVIDQVDSRAQVIAGAGSNNTRESIEIAQHAQQRGADAILCITPYYNKPTQDGLFAHYKALAQSVDMPVVMYNVPGRTGVNLGAETIERLCEFPTIIGVKEASGNIVQVSDIHRRCGDRLTILSGEDIQTLHILASGGKGAITVTGNVVPAKMCALIRAMNEGQCEKARTIHEDLFELFQALFYETNPIPVKTAMRDLGFPAGPLRLPLVEMKPDNKAKLTDVLKTYTIATP